MVDITADTHAYLFKADLREVKKDDVKVTIENGVPSIFGEGKTETEKKKKNSIRWNGSSGALSAGLQCLRTRMRRKSASFEDGVLGGSFAANSVSKPKPIGIKVQ